MEKMLCEKNRKEINRLYTEFSAKSCNEKLARSIVSAMAVQLDPTIDELSDIITAVSEAVTNSIIHGYGEKKSKKCNVKMECILYEDAICVEITDEGRGIEDIEKAREPMYTSSPEMERSGMGFTIMESFTDEIEVISTYGNGTTVRLFKIFKSLSMTEECGDSLCENTVMPQ